jgi:hypothetical protein
MADLSVSMMDNAAPKILSLHPTDAKGIAVALDAGSVAWSSDDPGVATVAVDPTDQTKASLSPVAPGSTNIVVQGAFQGVPTNKSVVAVTVTLDTNISLGVQSA